MKDVSPDRYRIGVKLRRTSPKKGAPMLFWRRSTHPKPLPGGKIRRRIDRFFPSRANLVVVLR